MKKKKRKKKETPARQWGSGTDKPAQTMQKKKKTCWGDTYPYPGEGKVRYAVQ
jgi:hypothetical protein